MSDFTLSVVSHGHGPLLRQLLNDLDAQPSLAGVRLVVTMNLADEPFDAKHWRHLDLVVIRNPSPRGFGANHNAAFAKCETAWFVVLNPDLRLSGGEPFTRLLASARTLGQVGVMAPLVVGADGSPEDAVRSNLTPWSLVGRRLLGHRAAVLPNAPAARGGTFYWLAGMCLMLNASAFRAVGAFDERFFMYCEDYDLCARLYNAGHLLAVDRSVRIVHQAQRDSHRSLRHLRWHVVSLSRVWTSSAFWRVTLA